MTSPEPDVQAYKSTPAICAICGDRELVDFGLVRWRDPLPGAVFDSAWRCRDRMACRRRCEAIGDLWPIDDKTPPSTPTVFDE